MIISLQLGGLYLTLLVLLGVLPAWIKCRNTDFCCAFMILSVGNTRLGHVLFGGFTAALLWEAMRHGLSWYFTSISKACIVYGSLTTSVVVLLSMEFAATLQLFSAQGIAEYEKM